MELHTLTIYFKCTTAYSYSWNFTHSSAGRAEAAAAGALEEAGASPREEAQGRASRPRPWTPAGSAEFHGGVPKASLHAPGTV